MFSQDSYRNACRRLTLDRDKLEEMISVTEGKKKKPMGRACRVVLIAAALTAALAVTAVAANFEEIQQLFLTYTITVSDDADLTTAAVLPTFRLEEREGKTFLVVGEEVVDVTAAVAGGEAYTYTAQDGSYAVTVQAGGQLTATVYDKDGGEVYSFSDQGNDAAGVYTVTEGDAPTQEDLKAVEADVNTAKEQ